MTLREQRTQRRIECNEAEALKHDKLRIYLEGAAKRIKEMMDSWPKPTKQKEVDMENRSKC